MYDDFTDLTREPDPSDFTEEFVEKCRHLAVGGNPAAQAFLGRALIMGLGCQKNITEAVAWLKFAAEKGVPAALATLGACYQNGVGVDLDAKTAVILYRKAAEAGLLRAQFNLALSYENGDGVEKDLKVAAEWYRKAAEKDDVESQFRLGQCYEFGAGVEMNLESAIHWYSKAAVKGQSKAVEALNRINKRNRIKSEDDHVVINRPEPSKLFLRARGIAGAHLEQMFKKYSGDKNDSFSQFRWIKPELTNPSFEHFTFGYKNSTFPVLVDVILDGESQLDRKEIELLIRESAKNSLVPCLIKVSCETLHPDASGLFGGKVYGKSGYKISVDPDSWNLFHAITGEALDPCRIAGTAPMRMSDWELRNFAIGIVRTYEIEKNGYHLDSFCDVPGIDPQLWFHDDSGEMSWGIVRFQNVLNEDAAKDFADFVNKNPRLAPYDGYFAPVSAVSAEPFETDFLGRIEPLSARFSGKGGLYRGHGFYVNFKGMVKIHSAGEA